MPRNDNVQVWDNLMKKQMYYNQLPLTKFVDEISSVKVQLVDAPDKHKLYRLLNNIGKVSFGLPWEEGISKKESTEFIQNFLDGGVLPLGGEFTKFSFLISGVTRVSTHALVRHRFVNVAQMSTGNRDFRHCDICVPRTLAKIENSTALEQFIKWCLEGKDKYAQCVDNQISVQDARMFLPSQNSNSIYLGFDIMSLVNFMSKRLDTTEEYLQTREGVCPQIISIMREKYPEIASMLKSSCGKSCAHSKNSPYVNGVYLPSKEDDVFDWHQDSFVYNKTQREMCWNSTPVRTRYFVGKNEVDERDFVLADNYQG